MIAFCYAMEEVGSREIFCVSFFLPLKCRGRWDKYGCGPCIYNGRRNIARRQSGHQMTKRYFLVDWIKPWGHSCSLAIWFRIPRSTISTNMATDKKEKMEREYRTRGGFWEINKNQLTNMPSANQVRRHGKKEDPGDFGDAWYSQINRRRTCNKRLSKLVWRIWDELDYLLDDKRLMAVFSDRGDGQVSRWKGRRHLWLESLWFSGRGLRCVQDIAQYIKKEVSSSHCLPPSPFRRSRLSQFDSRKGATWHCVVGRNFGSFVTHGRCLVMWWDGCKECANYVHRYRDEAFHLFLSRTLRHSPLQDPIDTSECSYLLSYRREGPIRCACSEKMPYPDCYSSLIWGGYYYCYIVQSCFGCRFWWARSHEAFFTVWSGWICFMLAACYLFVITFYILGFSDTSFTSVKYKFCEEYVNGHYRGQ